MDATVQPVEMNTTEKSVRAFFATFGTEQDWQSLVAEDILFKSPMDEIKGKDQFITLDQGFRQLVQQATVEWVITEEDQASALVNYDMALPTGDQFNITFSEIIRVRDAKMASIQVFFDTAKFLAFVSKLQ